MNLPVDPAVRLADVYVCRHGQTDFNAEARLQGQREVPLNALGREQAHRNGETLRDLLGERAAGFRFLCSPLGRATETMRIIRSVMGLDPQDFATEDRLVELSFGDWEASTLREVKARDPAGIAARKADKWNFRSPGKGGESYADLLARVRPLFEELGPETIVVAHGGIARAFLHAYGGLSEAEAAEAPILQDRILTLANNHPVWI